MFLFISHNFLFFMLLLTLAQLVPEGKDRMGGCFSSPTPPTPHGALKKQSVVRKIRRRIRGGKKNRSLRNHNHRSAAASSGPTSITGSGEEVWFEPVSSFGTDSEEEDYHTVADDAVSLNGWEDSSSSKFPSPVAAGNKYQNHALSNVSCGKDDSSNIPHNCFPCVINTSISSDKRSPVSAGKKLASVSPKVLQNRPVAGSQVPICPLGKEMFDSWSPIEPSTFRVRGMNYLRDKRKEHASNKAAYYPFGVDIYLSQRKISHIARLVELPAISSNSMLPALLVVNVQIPLYPPSIFQNENNGEGMNVIMYFKLSERFEKEVALLHFQESIRMLIDNEVEKIKGFHKDTAVPFRERLKILSRVANVDDLNLNAPQRKLMHAYNEKPILSRPQHEFYSGEGYFEIDIDMHRFNYISRKGFDAFQDKLKTCILDVGLTIQGNRAEELPEQVLCCLRVNGIDHTNYHQLEPCEDIL